MNSATFESIRYANNYLCPVNEDEYDPLRHLLPIAQQDIRAGEYVGLLVWHTFPFPCVDALPLDQTSDLWVVVKVGIAAEDAAQGMPIRVYCKRDSLGFWVYKFKTKEQLIGEEKHRD